MNLIKWLDLQLFGGEGAAGGEGGAASGEGTDASVGGTESVDAGQARLLELGVPADKLRKRAKKPASVLPEGAVRKTAPKEAQQVHVQDAAADTKANTTTEDKGQTAPAPDRKEAFKALIEGEYKDLYDEAVQGILKPRLKSARGAEEALSKLTPALEVLARAYNMDVNNLDYDALAKAVDEDERYYEEKAVELGTSTDTAKKFDQMERRNARAQREAEANAQQQRIAQHFASLESQGEALKATFPGFDLRTELKNPAFARMVSPNVNIPVEDAYYAVHRAEIQAAAMKITAEKTAEKMSNAIRAGGARPSENGTTGKAASVTKFDYRKASPEQRAALKNAIKDAAARGEKLYPGGFRG